ncbi:cytochrome P450 [Jatrophihabitans sp.]|jgi:cytochrome P450|uniref:cytochrome P450 n=1 Tax=Jatrophihabitans sp. TaxID=1932789 RepID=UPI002F1E6273
MSATTDLSDPSLYSDGDPEAAWDGLRSHTPLAWIPREQGGYWAVTGYELAREVLRDHEHFSSEGGMRLDADPRSVAASAGRMMIVTDPPRHRAIRRTMNSGFNPRTLRRIEASMRQVARAAIEEALERGEWDLVELASSLPVAVICDLLGVPEKDRAFMLQATQAAFAVDEGSSSDPLDAVEAHTALLVYYSGLVRQRRKETGDDVISAMINGSVDGAALDDVEIYLNCDGLISGGNETTRHATVGGLLALYGDPAQLRRLREDRSLIPGAVAEVLRWTSPALHVLRTATCDYELAGQQIRQGQPVAVWIAAANRDGAVFADPGVFRIDRPDNRHLSFATGAHTCIGAALATAELQVMIEEMLDRVADLEPLGPPVRLRSNLIWGYRSAPVRVVALENPPPQSKDHQS